MLYITRKSLLYKTEVEYGDYTINHVEGCAHGCKYPCYAMMMAKRFGRIKDYNSWCKPKIVSNAEELLIKELPKYKNKIHSVHLCFTTDPFMLGYPEISALSIRLIKLINNEGIKCTALTKGLLPIELANLKRINSFGITLVSLNENFRKQYEPNASSYKDRLKSLYNIHNKGIRTWVSIEPYPTPNIIQQDINDILNSISFVDKIIFGRLNYNSLVTKYPNYKEFFNRTANIVIDYCIKNNIEYYIKKGTITKV